MSLDGYLKAVGEWGRLALDKVAFSSLGAFSVVLGVTKLSN